MGSATNVLDHSFRIGGTRKFLSEMKISSIVIRCYEFDKMQAFWQEALHYVPREPAKGVWVVLTESEMSPRKSRVTKAA